MSTATGAWVNLTDPGGYVTLFASAARTATPTSTDQSNAGFRGLHVVIDVTAVTSTPSVVPTLQGFDVRSAKYYSLLVGDAITATGTTVLKLYPGITPLTAGAAADVLPASWRVLMAHGNANSITYTVTAALFR